MMLATIPLDSVVQERGPVQRGRYHRPCIRVVSGDARAESHSCSPSRGSFRVKSAQNDPTLSRKAFHHRRYSIRIFADDLAPALELRTVLPVLVQFLVRVGNHNVCLRRSPATIIPGVEPDTRSQI